MSPKPGRNDRSHEVTGSKAEASRIGSGSISELTRTRVSKNPLPDSATTGDQGSVSRRGGGPRSREGKLRSRYNARKDGIFCSALIADRESIRDFEKLVNRLRESTAPVGALEESMVEKLAMLIWRHRRLLTAEAAHIALEVDSAARRHRGGRRTIREEVEQYGLVTAGYKLENELALAMGSQLLEDLLQVIRRDGLEWERDRPVITYLYGPSFASDDFGTQAEERVLIRTRRIPLVGRWARSYRRQSLLPEKKRNNARHNGRYQRKIVSRLKKEIKQMRGLAAMYFGCQLDISEWKEKSSLVPSPMHVERFLRYEATLDRAFARTLAQLERLQRMRLGWATLPPLELNVSV